MRESIGNFYRGHIRNRITELKTVFGQTTAENIARQLKDSKPVDFDALLEGESKNIKPSKIDERGEIIDEDKK